jgi:hypothetical protein
MKELHFFEKIAIEDEVIEISAVGFKLNNSETK